MFTDNYNLNGLVKDKQARFQAEAAQERLLKACAVPAQTWGNSAQPKIRRPGRLSFRFRFARHGVK
jgi:hypothetical protein